MNLYAEARGGALVVSVNEERLDAAIAIRFKERMREVTIQPSGRVVLDNAGESEHQARYTLPVTGDLFAGGADTS